MTPNRLSATVGMTGLLVAIAFAWSPPAAADAVTRPPSLAMLDAEARERIEAGEVVTMPLAAGELEGAVAFARVPVSRATVWEALVDYRSFPRWMDGVEAVTTITWHDNGTTADVGFVIPSPFRDVEYVLRRTHRPPAEVTWDKLSGDLEVVRGGYRLYAADASATVVRYHALVELGVWVPRFIRRLFEGRKLERQMTDIRAESRRRAETGGETTAPTP